jgi:putative glutathione S-transferase
MGLLVNAEWSTDWYDTKSTNGEYIRQDSQFRNWITKDGLFKPEVGRYHLYVSLACPWAHRSLIFRKLKKLEDVISVTAVKPEMLENGWELPEKNGGPIKDINYLWEVYTTSDANYSGRVTVPVLWDKKTNQIVNNESSEIIRMLNSEFNDFTDVKTDYYPEAKRREIDAINDIIYHNINNGVYKTGFATTQEAYEKNFSALFNTLEEIDMRLDTRRYLTGNEITEADWRLFTTLIRFDSVYFGHFKTNLRRIEDFKNLPHYLRDLFQQNGVAETVNFNHIKTHYYYSHDTINPTRIVPRGPEVDYLSPHNRV